MRFRRKGMVGVLAAGLAMATPLAFAQGTDDDAFGDRVRAYLLENPEILAEMQQALEAKREEAERVAQAATLEKQADLIFRSENDAVLGNPDGDVTIVEFFDYNCGFCERAMADMQTVIEADPDVRFVLKEFPILGPASLDAHTVSMAVARIAPDTYDEFHRRLLSGDARADGDTAVQLALDLGIDEEALRSAVDDPASQQAFAEAYQLADSLRITGTPSYVVGGEVLFGAVGAEALLERIERVRSVSSETTQ